MPPPDELVVRAIRDDDQLKKLSLGHADYAPLKSFLARRACSYESCSVARTHVLVDRADAERGGRVWGYVTLVASEVDTTPNNRPGAEVDWPDEFGMPAIKLARMAVDQELQGRGFGSALLDWTVALVNDYVARHVGCRLLVTDAKKQAVRFYERHGFTLLDTNTNRARPNPVMFIVLGRLAPS